MTKKLLLSFCVLSGFSFGQSFTTANEYAIGETQTMYMCDSAAPSYSAVTGTGVTWDYSTYMKMPNNSTRTYSVAANANTTDFPNSNKQTEITGVLTTMLQTTSTERNIDGLVYVSGGTFGTITANFNTDNMHVMDYDFALNASVVDAFSGTVTYNGGSSAATGTVTSTVDGYGTLKLSPSVTRTNVLRHHMVDTINTTVFGIISVKLIINEFDYYDFVDNNLPLFSFVNIKIVQGGSAISDMNFVLNSVEPAYTVGMAEQEKSAFKVFPNPAGNSLQVTGELNGSESFTIFDLAGKSVLISSSAKMDVSNLLPGVYVVEVEKDGIRSQQKFIKK